MAVEPGGMLSYYRLVEKIGEGGMGVVWKALDTTLDRHVAIKILPESLATDSDRLARFEREAKLLASLNHPNIASIYSVHQHEGARFLAMELVEGQDLAARLEGGAIPVHEAIDIARQVAEALEAAHERGVIHRDLKPANIQITPDGTVKVLDLGLAKALLSEDRDQGGALSLSPTVTSAGSVAGVILGTAAYMAPEQAKGIPVDRRTDIWAFGAVLFEMLTGSRLHEAKTVSETLAAVIMSEPDLERLPVTVPAFVRRLIGRCLEKDPKQRLRDIGEARIVLSAADDGAPDQFTGSPTVWRPTRRIAFSVIVAAVAVSAILVGRWVGQRETVQEMRPIRFSIPIEAHKSNLPRISPDGRFVVFEGHAGLMLHSLHHGNQRAMEGAENANEPFWSPDSRAIAFFADGMLRKIRVAGGPPETIAQVPRGWLVGSWAPDGAILFEVTENPDEEGWYLLRPGARVPERIRSYGTERKLSPDKAYPYFLPDSRHFLFTQSIDGVSQLQVGSIDTEETEVLLPATSRAKYIEPGYLLFVREGALLAQPFDAVTRSVTGDPSQIVESVFFFAPTGAASFSASNQGSLIFRAPQGEVRIIWMDRGGRELGEVIPPGRFSDPSLSPDGDRLVVELNDPRTGTPDLWLHDLGRNMPTRLTSDRRGEYTPIWSPDGSTLAFSTDWDGPPNIYLLRLDGGAPQVLVPANRKVQWPGSWSPDGKNVAFSMDNPETDKDLWIVSLEDPTPRQILGTTFKEEQPRISPDGRWLAYVSNETGTREVYVASFPGLGARRRVSDAGGTQPRWRADGKELFYLGRGGSVRSVSIRPNAGRIETGTPQTLFSLGSEELTGYDVTSTEEGERFLMMIQSRESRMPPIEIIVNWQEALGIDD